MTASRNTGKPSGRPAYVPTDEDRKRVLALVAFGLTEKQIAGLIFDDRSKKPITDRTLRKYFKPELARGFDELNSQVALSLFRKAVGNGPQSVSAAIFWVKCRMGWRDVNRTELTGPNGGPISVYSDADLAKLTDAELDTVKNVITKMQKSARETVDQQDEDAE